MKVSQILVRAQARRGSPSAARVLAAREAKKITKHALDEKRGLTAEEERRVEDLLATADENVTG